MSIDWGRLQYARSSGSEWDIWRAGDCVIDYLSGILEMTADGKECFPAGEGLIACWQDKLKEWESAAEANARETVAAVLFPYADVE